MLALPQVDAQEQISLEALTEQGTFMIEILWTPNDIGRPNMFEIHFIDPGTGIEIEEIKYDISINRYNDEKPEIQRLDQTSTFQEILFEEQGSYEIRIDDIEDLGEGVTVPIQVTTEFRPEILVLFVSVCLGVGIIAGRHNTNSLFRKSIQ
jgi:hypothetical protein